MAEPKMISGAWWAQQPDGSWLKFDDAAQQWVASPRGPLIETPTMVSQPMAAAAPEPGAAVAQRTPVAAPSAVAVPSESPVSAATVPAAKRSFSFGTAPIITWFVLGAAALVVVGSIGPWAKVLGFITVNGLDADGALTVFLGGLAAVMAIIRASGRGIWTLIVAAVSFGLSGLIGIVDWADLETVAGDTEGLIEVGWGLVVMTLASLAGAVISVVAIFVRGSRGAAATAALAD